MLKGSGFLGTGASLGADITLIAYVFLLIPLMIIGFRYARGKKFDNHKYVMTTVAIINWILILLVMFVSYKESVLPGVPAQLKLPFFLTPSVHMLIGGTAQILATYLVIRMWFENRLPSFLLIKNFKPFMQTTLALWLLAATLGIATYAVWYLTPPSADAPVAGFEESELSKRVLLQNFEFSPSEITVVAGTTITWPNQDNARHNVTFDDGSVASADFFQGGEFSFTFDEVGSFAIHCSIHGGPGGSGMSTVVQVVEASE